MTKSYDRVEWHYLEATLLKQCFSINFVRLIMKCVSSVRFTVGMNGELLPYFTLSRGLWLGDRISPFLFLLCAEGLTSLLNQLGGAYVNRGLKLSPRSPWVNHLLFANDSLIFISAMVQSADRLHQILWIYAESLGQSVSHEKCDVFSSVLTRRLPANKLWSRH